MLFNYKKINKSTTITTNMIYILYSIFKINWKTSNSFFGYKIVGLKRESQICLFFEAESFFKTIGLIKTVLSKNSISIIFIKKRINKC